MRVELVELHDTMVGAGAGKYSCFDTLRHLS